MSTTPTPSDTAARALDRTTLLASLSQDMGRDLSTAMVMYVDAVADQIGINVTDLNCLDLLGREGRLTAGRMAELTGLTTGAITAVIDRLEAAGYATRSRDDDDRRRVYVEPTTKEGAGILYADLCQAWTSLLDRYDDRELVVLHEFLASSITMLELETTKLRALNAAG